MKRAPLIGLPLLFWPALAWAQASPPTSSLDPNVTPAPAGVHLVDDAEPKLPLVPRAKDLLGGHLLVGASAGPSWSLGKLGSQSAAVRSLGTGLTLNADLGFGLSRSVALGVWGNFARYADGDSCSSCNGQAFGVGPFVRYHLSQGLRFDPWLLAGAGFRQLGFSSSRGDKFEFSGAEWLHLQLGADYYLFSGFGLGPYGALSLSSYSTRPSDSGDASVNTELSFGLRLLLDVPGR